jgi:hypothetical protein
MTRNSFAEWTGDSDPYSAQGVFSLSRAKEGRRRNGEVSSGNGRRCRAMSYLHEKYESEKGSGSGKEQAFSSYEGEYSFRCSAELLAPVFLWLPGRSKIREHERFQF